MKRLSALALVLVLVGCSSVPNIPTFDTPLGNTGKPSTFAKAVGADAATTTATQLLTKRTELNPVIVACSHALGLGPHAGIILCTVAASVALYEVIAHVNNPSLTSAATIAEFWMAGRNIYVFKH